MNEKQSLKSAFNELSTKEKVLIIAQTALSLIVLVIAILGLCKVGNGYTMNCIAMILLGLLLIVNAIRLFPTRKLSAIVYIIIAIIVFVMIGKSLII